MASCNSSVPARLLNARDYEAAAKDKLAPSVFAALARGRGCAPAAVDSAFNLSVIRPRFLVDVTKVCTETRVLGVQLKVPILASSASPGWPQGLLQSLHSHGAQGVVEASSKSGAGVVVCAANALAAARCSGCPLAIVRIPRGVCSCSRKLTATVEAARAAGATAVMLSLQAEPDTTWWHVDQLVKAARGAGIKAVVDGVVAPADALQAAELGADAVVVSCHSGEEDPSTAVRHLPGVVKAVGSRLDVLVEGGVMRGTDVVKAVALGAKAVIVGRPAAWGLAVNGTQGVQAVLEILCTELASALMLTGCPRVDALSSNYVQDPPSASSLLKLAAKQAHLRARL